MSVETLIPLEAFTNWLATGERGMSSDAIVARLTRKQIGRFESRGDYPHDPSDFRRCQLLLNAVPLARLLFPQMRSLSPVWARLVDHWDEIDALIEAEAPNYLTQNRGVAPLAYRLMRRLIEDGVECETCAGSGRAEVCPKCKGTGRRSAGYCRYPGCSKGYLVCHPCRGNGFTQPPSGGVVS